MAWRETDNIQGCALVVGREVFDRIGGFDGAFFTYGGENDFELRARRAGFRMVENNVPVWHFNEGSFGKTPLWAARLAMEAEIRLALKHDGALQTLRRLVVLVASGCLPFYRVDRGHPPARRRRPSNPVVDGALLAAALGANLKDLRGILEQRRVGRGGRRTDTIGPSPYIDRLH